MKKRNRVCLVGTILWLGVLAGACSSRQERLTSDDVMVLAQVLRHFSVLATSPDTSREVPIIRTDVRRIPTLTTILIASTNLSSHRLVKEDVIKEDCERSGHALASGLLHSLRVRNRACVSLDTLRSQSPAFRVVPIEPFLAEPLAMERSYSNACAFVWVALPGYDRNGTTSLVQFWLGPAPHGAFAVYHLTKGDGKWSIDWHRIDAFL